MTLPNISDLEFGKAAEHLVVADLILSGYRAYLTDQGIPYDIVLDDNGYLYRVQVKATREQKPVPQRKVFTPGYLFQVRRAGKAGSRRYNNEEFDLVALVALDVRAIAYMPIRDIVTSSVCLRPPQYALKRETRRLGNIDEYPVKKALSSLKNRGIGPIKVLRDVNSCNANASTADTNSRRSRAVVTDLFAETRQTPTM